MPLKRDEQVLGALMVYAAEPDTFDAGEVELLTQLAGDLAYGITALRTRAEQERAEAARQAAQPAAGEHHRVPAGCNVCD